MAMIFRSGRSARLFLEGALMRITVSSRVDADAVEACVERHRFCHAVERQIPVRAAAVPSGHRPEKSGSSLRFAWSCERCGAMRPWPARRSWRKRPECRRPSKSAAALMASTSLLRCVLFGPVEDPIPRELPEQYKVGGERDGAKDGKRLLAHRTNPSLRSSSRWRELSLNMMATHAFSLADRTG